MPPPLGGPRPRQHWRHAKAGLYESLGVARHAVTGEEFVIYGKGDLSGLWARPRPMFEDGRFVRVHLRH